MSVSEQKQNLHTLKQMIRMYGLTSEDETLTELLCHIGKQNLSDSMMITTVSASGVLYYMPPEGVDDGHFVTKKPYTVVFTFGVTRITLEVAMKCVNDVWRLVLVSAKAARFGEVLSHFEDMTKGMYTNTDWYAFFDALRRQVQKSLFDNEGFVINELTLYAA